MWDIVWISSQGHRVCKAPNLSTGPAVPLTGKETVQERPLLSYDGETRLPDCGVVHQVGIDHQSQLPGFPLLTSAAIITLYRIVWL